MSEVPRSRSEPGRKNAVGGKETTRNGPIFSSMSPLATP